MYSFTDLRKTRNVAYLTLNALVQVQDEIINCTKHMLWDDVQGLYYWNVI